MGYNLAADCGTRHVFYLYLILDVYSRKVVAWEVRDRETAEYAACLLGQAVLSEKCMLDPPILHARITVHPRRALPC